MAVPPCYADLGKSAKDIFNKGYGMESRTLTMGAVMFCVLQAWRDLWV